MATFGERIVGAAKLRAATYEDVEHDTTAMGQAVAIVVMSSIAAALGAPLSYGRRRSSQRHIACLDQLVYLGGVNLRDRNKTPINAGHPCDMEELFHNGFRGIAWSVAYLRRRAVHDGSHLLRNIYLDAYGICRRCSGSAGFAEYLESCCGLFCGMADLRRVRNFCILDQCEISRSWRYSIRSPIC